MKNISLDFKFSKKVVFLLFFILIGIGVFLRVVHLGQLPAVMHRDELAIAYNAYSILETGHDEWGEKLPIVFKSFGDYKLPGLIYSTIVGIKLFGATVFGARVVTALLASFAIPLIFFFTKELYRSKFVSFVSMIFLVFSFWHISGSRNIYEPIIALSLTIPSYWFLFKSIKKRNYLFLSILFYAISIWFYHTPLFIYPGLFILWFAYNWKTFSRQMKTQWVIGLVVILFVSIFNFSVLSTLNKGRSGTTIFFSQELKDIHQTNMHKYWSAGVPLYPAFTTAERAFQVSYYFVQGYVKGVSPDFIFFSGGNNAWHNLRSIGFGNSNPVLIPFVLLGLVFVVKNRKKAPNYFLLCLLLLSPIPNALTVDSPNTNRLLDFHFLLLILSALGVYYFVSFTLERKSFLFTLRRFLYVAATLIYIVFTSQFLASYFLTYNRSLESVWNEGFPELVQRVEEHRKDYDKVIISTDTPQSYIFYSFYTQYLPQNIQMESHTEYIENVYFSVDFSEIDEDKESVLFVTSATPLQENPVFIVKNWEGRPIWQGYVLEGMR